jgi:hypothetical protein
MHPMWRDVKTLGIFPGRLNDLFVPKKLMPVSAVFIGIGFVFMPRLSFPWQRYLIHGIIFGGGLSFFGAVAFTAIASGLPQKGA